MSDALPMPSAQPHSEAPATTSARAKPSLRYAWYVVAVLTVIYVFSFIDRQIFSLLVGPLRRDLGITDTQVSLLMGLSFALFYTFFGVPIGRAADMYSRRGIIAVGLILWSGFTTGCGLARTFPQMLALRTGVGVGEAALSPAAYSLITDYFPPERLSTAISVYAMGIYIGSGVAYILGGYVVAYANTRDEWTVPVLGAIRSWQLIFLIVGLPGILLAFLLLTVREPARGLAQKNSSTPLRIVIRYVFQNARTFFLHNMGFAFLALSTYAAAGWVPEFFRRHFHWSIQKTGLIYGTIVLVFGSLGISAAGWVADAVRSRGRQHANVLVGAWVALLTIPVTLAFTLIDSPVPAIICLIPAAFLGAAPFGIAPAAIQQMMPPTMRAQASAVYLFVLNLIGLGIGPSAVALCSQYIFRRDDAIHLSLAVVICTSCAIAALLLFACSKPFIASLDHLRRWHPSQSSANPS